jgi:hypothetical protein
MKHAGPDALQTLAPLLERIRRCAPLVEKRVGIFYLKSKAFLHFHEDPSGMFADVRLDGADFSRFRVKTKEEQTALVQRIHKHLSSLKLQP